MAVPLVPVDSARSDLRARLRIQLLQITASASSLAALSAMLDPDRIAQALGLFLAGVNGYSQFFAVHVGIRIAIAGLALLAAKRDSQPILGDIVAILILAQPLGRFVAAFAIGLPQGFLFAVCGIELVVGLALLLLRPRGPLFSP